MATPTGDREPDPDRVLDRRRIVFDCRWLGLGGAGRVTELLLRQFQTMPPPGAWILWGDPNRIQPLAFEGATVAPWAGDPRALAGQRDVRRVPAGDVVLYGHQIRPLRPGRSVTVIHDTIPLRYGSSAGARALKRLFFRVAAELSDHVLTDSDFALACVARDLQIPPEKISVLMFPPDFARAKAIADLRARLRQERRLLYVGRFAAHKNLYRLCEAFRKSRFAGQGGRLLLAGGWAGEVDEMREFVSRLRVAGVEIRGYCSEEELDWLLATSRALILPSLEEGFGLPAFEAAASGLPVAVSRTGALTTLSEEYALFFDARDVQAMERAIDAVVRRPALPPWPPQPSDFSRVVLDAVGRALDRRR